MFENTSLAITFARGVILFNAMFLLICCKQFESLSAKSTRTVGRWRARATPIHPEPANMSNMWMGERGSNASVFSYPVLSFCAGDKWAV